jgi:alkylhydroperoxidase family enzyme
MTTPPGPGGVLDRRTLNRTLLARQHLLRRVAMPVPEMIEHLVGMQAQVPRDPYISLWSRLLDFEPTVLEELMLERKTVRMTLMRTTLHLVTARDAGPLRAATQAVCERGFASSPFSKRLDGVDVEELRAVGASIVEAQPLSIAELGKRLGERWPDGDAEALAYAVRYLVPVVQVTPRGLLRRSSAPRITTLAAWLHQLGAESPVTDLPDEIVLRYLGAFGPATIADVRAWSWLTDVRGVVDRLRPRLVTYRDQAGRQLLDVEDGVIADPDEPAPPRFTGEYDNVFIAHADRSRITGDSTWGAGFIRKGAFFVDGFLAGAWRLISKPGRTALAIEPMRPLSAAERAEVEVEAVALLGLLAPETEKRDVEWAA